MEYSILLNSCGINEFLSLGPVNCITLAVGCSFAYRPYQYFKQLGIPGPPPLPFIGNLHQAKVCSYS